MMVGRRIYFEKATGNVIVDTGQRSGSVIERTTAVDILEYPELFNLDRSSFDVLQLPYGAYNNEFLSATSYKVNPTTKELEFTYPTP